MNEATPHAATIPAQTMNRRCEICQKAEAACMYQYMPNPPMMAQITNEMRPEASAR